MRTLPGLPTLPGIGPATLIKGGSDLYRLFANGEDGFLFGNFGDLTRLFTTSQGPTQVANDGDPVGLALEDSRWQKRTLTQQLAQATDALGGLGDFSSASGWSYLGGSGTISGGKANFSGDTTLQRVDRTLTQNTTYRCTFTIESLTLGTATGVSMRLGVANISAAYTTPGTYTEYITYTGATGAAGINIVGRGGTPNISAAVIDNFTVVPVAGNHALQSVNTGYRPLYKPNSGKPYELFDGSDDYQVTPFIPTAALTLACAVRFPAAGASSIFAIGGGNSTGNKRAFIGKVATTGTIAVGWGQETAGTYALGPDLGTTDHVLVLTGDGTSRDIWLDGALIDSRAPLAGLKPDGTGGGVALGAYNSNGSVVGFAAARIYAALGLNRRATISEIGTITSKFRSAYQ